MNVTIQTFDYPDTLIKIKIRSLFWLGFRDGNITFQDSLDFDLSEIESVYIDEEEGLK